MLEDGIIRGPHSHEDIEQKLAFMTNLAATEFKSSNPSSNPQHMHQILQRLESARNSFNERDKDSISHFTTFSNPEFDKDSLSNSNSTSSFNESCLNDAGETLDESGMIVFDEPDKLFPEFIGEKAIVKFRGNGVEKVGGGKIGKFYFQDAEDSFEDFGMEKQVVENKYKKLKREGRGKNGFGKNCCALVSGVCIGMILMGFIMVNLSGCFEYGEQTRFVIPT
ncbi:transmembrane protein, putative [Medicago truncatula]|nr:transmembrane protein, putative [Medicago truncatula]